MSDAKQAMTPVLWIALVAVVVLLCLAGGIYSVVTPLQDYLRPVLVSLFVIPGVLALALLAQLYLAQRRRAQGAAVIREALQRVAAGDLTVQVPEDSVENRELVRQLNASIARQRELFRGARDPLEMANEAVDKLAKSASGQLDKSEGLTRSVMESTTAVSELLGTADAMKSATEQAAGLSQTSNKQVAQAYELTRDMSRTSADVRESVQETSKSAKRQGELIQSVTTAAEYIQSLNTKISVVAINTRIEAEKAGEHGRPFLGIAEAIGDLLREAEEEGRKIVAEVRMLQNLSAENLSSMENTVGAVVRILEYIDRLEGSLEDIHRGSTEIAAAITAADASATQSAVQARHINTAMGQLRERNLDLAEYSEQTQVGSASLQQSLRAAAAGLGQFRVEPDKAPAMTPVSEAGRVYDEGEMTALERAGAGGNASL